MAGTSPAFVVEEYSEPYCFFTRRVDVDASDLPDLIVLDEAQAVLHFHVVGLEYAAEHQRAVIVDLGLFVGVVVRG